MKPVAGSPPGAGADGLGGPPGRLLDNLVLFSRVLRAAGLDATPDETAVLATACEEIGIASRRDLRDAARAVFVRRHGDIPLFERLFDLFFAPPRERGSPRIDLGELLERAARSRRRAVRLAAAPEGGGDDASAAPLDDEPEEVPAWSAGERLARKDFSRLTEEERAAVARLVRGMEIDLPPRRTRRTTPATRGPRPDLRRALRRSLGLGDEARRLPWRRRKAKARPLVVLCDVSGSMEVYSRLLLQFVYALGRGRGTARFEAFAFGTRLTRLSRALTRRDVDRALADAAGRVVDWGGGTRIGESLRQFNLDWGRRVLGQGAVVLLISDGWDRGEPELLAREMARLRRSSSRLIWLNPLLGSPGFEPLARGLVAGLPWVDHHLPVHNLASLRQLADRLRHLNRIRSGERPAGVP